VVTISRNGNKIDGFDRNVVISTDRDGVELVYVSGDIGFVTREQKTEGRFFGTQAQGESFGYASGGSLAGGTRVNTIEKYQFSTTNNATDVGDLSETKSFVGGVSSLTNGYTIGGFVGSATTRIDKFPFTIDTNATNIGDLSGTATSGGVGGHESKTDGYRTGGSPPEFVTTIDKFPFATDTNATAQTGVLTEEKGSHAAMSSSEFAYLGAGERRPAPEESNVIEKFPFSSDVNSVDVGDTSFSARKVTGLQSSISGYIAMGQAPTSPEHNNVIDKFPFATDGNSTDIADMLAGQYGMASSSSLTEGFIHGGIQVGPSRTDTIQKFPFASDSNCTDVSNLTESKTSLAGHQV